jgi:flotillin
MTFLVAMQNAQKIAETADTLWGAFAVPVIILLLVVVFGALARSLSKRYVKVPPQKALIIYGGGKTRVVSGGAKFVLPMIENFYFLDLALFQFDVELKNVPNKDSVPISVKAAVSAKISNKEDMLPVAAGMFGEVGLKDITDKVRGIVDGHVRALIGQSDMETILRDQDKFKQQIQSVVATELGKIGCEIVVLNIQEVNDPNGVILALGTPEIARVKAEAAIKEAEQTRRQVIDTTNAQREAQKIKAGNEAQIADADRDLNMKKAQYDAEVARERAKADQAGPLATAEAQKAVVAAEVAVTESETEAKIKLQDKVQQLNEKELQATLITKANAQKQESVIVAEGQKQALIITADGAKQKLVTEADGAAQARQTKATAERQALQAEGEGQAAKTKAEGDARAEVTRKVGFAEADSTKARMLAEAEGKSALAASTQQELLAHAEGVKAEGLARAAGVEAELLAQATGVQKLLESFDNLSPDQMAMVRTKWVLEALPGAIEKLGEAGEKVMGKIAEPIAAAIGSIDNVTVYDSMANGNGQGSLERFAKIGPNALFQVMQSLKETGMLPAVAGALTKLGVDPTVLLAGGVALEQVTKSETADVVRSEAK